ncbi:hypothetical protein COCHEDRAFT_1019948 [Bipolaris maydis C5]|uniref:Uncharacterized protein n=1 Tax=Cochliobolus heterostrophus (strain C5 / ATCC 48332 / race O) TaxID=701091 RepID=M2TC29_COCH5|nr:hypothetical protein COCHEDRAFT_1022005 [Bipolaris maydis C5]EMD95120.1 hypothetical protein COCHEDRAFT_1019948 [Bipolaris maydis C5]
MYPVNSFRRFDPRVVPGVRRRFQEYGGGSRSTEEVPGVRRRFQEYGGGSRSTEEVPGSL